MQAKWDSVGLIGGTAKSGLGGAAFGALFGCIYQLLVHLPPGRIIQAYAVWGAAEGALKGFVDTLLGMVGFRHVKPVRVIANKSILILSGTVGINLLRQRGLMCDYMAIVVSIYYLLAIFK